MKLIKTTTFLIASFFSFTVSAQGYFSLGVGFASLDEANFDVAPGTVTTDYDDGLAVRAAYGYQFASFRAEIELAKYVNDVESHSLGGANLDGPTGEASALTLMVNGYIDFDTGSGSALTPYIGLGIGNADLDFSGYGVNAIPNVLDDDDSVLAYQLMLGGSYALSPSTSLYGEYRYLTADDASVQTSFETGGVETGIDYDANILQFGINFNF